VSAQDGAGDGVVSYTMVSATGERAAALGDASSAAGDFSLAVWPGNTHLLKLPSTQVEA
jgi:hypothetical protein